MAINWNNVAAPNLGESNSLFAQAIQSLKDAGIGLKDTAKDYQTVVRNKSHAILQDYINSAKTPEELQSEAFNTGFKNLQATLANEYDAVKVNDYRDTRGDVLTKRAGDAVALKRNTLGLTTEQQAVDTNDMMNRIFTAPESERPALIAEAVKLNRFDAKGMLTNQVGNAQLTQATNANELFKVQKPFLEVQPDLTNQSTRESIAASQARTSNAAAQLKLQAEELEIKRQEATRKANGGDIPYAQTPNGIADAWLKNYRDIEKNMAAENAAKFPDKTPAAYVERTTKEGGVNYQYIGKTPAALDAVMESLDKNPIYQKLAPHVKASVLADTMASMQSRNLGGSTDWVFPSLNTKRYEELGNAAIAKNTAYIQQAKEAQAIARQDFINTLQRTGGMDEAHSIAYANKVLGILPDVASNPTASAVKAVKQAATKPVAVVVVPPPALSSSLSSGAAWFQPRK